MRTTVQTRFALYGAKTTGMLLIAAAATMAACTLSGRGQTASPATGMQVSPAASAGKAPASAQPATGAPTRFQPPLIARRAELFYQSLWGVDSLSVRAVESGELIRFTYRVLDPERSRLLNDKKLEPLLIFPAGHVKLIIPSLEKVGQLRQSSTPEAGKSYWMAFSNPSRAVKRGDRVDIQIGQFHAEGLTVE